MSSQRSWFFVLAVLIPGSFLGQNMLSLESPDWMDYPEFQAELWTRNWDGLQADRLEFKANGERIEFEVDSVWVEEDAIEMDFFFLVENSPRLDYPDQLEYFKSIMNQVLQVWNPPADSRFFLAEFDRKISDEDCLRWINPTGTKSTFELSNWFEMLSTPPDLKQVLENRRPESRLALFEGAEFAADFAGGNRRQALVLLSRENSDPFVASPTPLEIISLARANDVAVYSIYAPMPEESRWQRYRPEIHEVTDKTFGDEISAAQGTNGIVNFLDQIRPHHAGVRRLISSELEMTNPFVPTDLVVSYFGEQSFVALGPVGGWTWVRSDSKRLGIFVALSIVVVLLVAGGVVWSVHKRTKEKKRLAHEMMAVEQKFQDEANRNSHELSELKRESEKLRFEQSERERAGRERERTERLAEHNSHRLRRFSNLQRSPSLLISGGGMKVVHQMDVRIGRSSADIILSDDTVSKQHAEISYQISSASFGHLNRSEGFYIRDLNSTNGTFVNGQQIRGGEFQYKLQDGDVIALGNVLLTFKS